jgi:hypothetical protein
MHSRFLPVLPVIVLLGACGGGGGNGAVRPAAFTAFSNVTPGQTVTPRGISQTQNVILNPSGTVTAQSLNAPDSASSSVRFTYAPGGVLTLTGIGINTPQSSVNWVDGRAGQAVFCGSRFCSATTLPNGSAGVTINPTGSVGWNYQTFGYWLSDSGVTASVAGAISVGNATSANSIPLSGMATYSGVSGRLYVNPAGDLMEHAATLSAAVNFGARTVDFSTTGTTIRPWNSGAVPTPQTQLDISGQLTYAAGTNRFSGPLTTGPVTLPTMTGSATGQFYGPTAQEMGGTFALTSTTSPVESMTGGFGARR